MKKIIMILTLCGFMMFPHISYAYDGEMSGTGATEVSYTASELVITAPVETVTVPKTEDSHEITGYLLAISGAFLLFLILLYRREEEEKKTFNGQ